jgi:hypothetical protein
MIHDDAMTDILSFNGAFFFSLRRHSPFVVLALILLIIGQVYQNVLWKCEQQHITQQTPHWLPTLLELANAGAIGVDPAYLKIRKESERHSKTRTFRQSHLCRGEWGIGIGPTKGDFRRHTFRALQNWRDARQLQAWLYNMSQDHIFHILKEWDGKTSKTLNRARHLSSVGGERVFERLFELADSIGRATCRLAIFPSMQKLDLAIDV